MFLLECQLARGDGSELLEKKGGKRSGRAEGAFTEFCFCVLNADMAEQTHRLMREGKSLPFLTTKWFGPFFAPLPSN